MTTSPFNDMLALTINVSTLQKTDYLLIGLGTLVLLIGLSSWLVRGARDPLRSAPRRVNSLTPELAILPFLVWMVGSYVSEGVIAAINNRADAPIVPEDLSKLMMTSGGQITGSIACLWVGSVYFRDGLAGFGFRRRGFWGDIATIVLAMLAVVPMLYLLNELTAAVISLFEKDFEPPAHKLLQTLDMPEQPTWAAPVLWASAVLIAPIAEELFFRGIIQTGLRHVFAEGVFVRREDTPASPAIAIDKAIESTDSAESESRASQAKATSQPQPVPRGRGKWPAILATGFIFGMVHYPQPHAVPALILFGVMMGYAYEKRGSLLPCIGMHMLFNLKTMIWFTLRGGG